jgi:membrane protease YdiL (CAAX protease family)
MNKGEFLLTSLVLAFFQFLMGDNLGMKEAIGLALFMFLGGTAITFAIIDKKIQKHDFKSNRRGIPKLCWIIGVAILLVFGNIKVFIGTESEPIQWVDIPLSLGFYIVWFGFIVVFFRSYRKPK